MRGKNATSGMKRHPCSVSRSPLMRASSSLLKNRIKQAVTLKEIDLPDRQQKSCMTAGCDGRRKERPGEKKLKIISRRNRLPHCGKNHQQAGVASAGAGLTPLTLCREAGIRNRMIPEIPTDWGDTVFCTGSAADGAA